MHPKGVIYTNWTNIIASTIYRLNEFDLIKKKKVAESGYEACCQSYSLRLSNVHSQRMRGHRIEILFRAFLLSAPSAKHSDDQAIRFLFIIYLLRFEADFSVFVCFLFRVVWRN